MSTDRRFAKRSAITITLVHPAQLLPDATSHLLKNVGLPSLTRQVAHSFSNSLRLGRGLVLSAFSAAIYSFGTVHFNEKIGNFLSCPTTLPITTRWAHLVGFW